MAHGCDDGNYSSNAFGPTTEVVAGGWLSYAGDFQPEVIVTATTVKLVRLRALLCFSAIAFLLSLPAFCIVFPCLGPTPAMLVPGASLSAYGVYALQTLRLICGLKDSPLFVRATQLVSAESLAACASARKYALRLLIVSSLSATAVVLRSAVVVVQLMG